jgi:hypothetical protein
MGHGWWEGVLIAAIIFLGCRWNSHFPGERLNVRELDPFGFVRKAFEVESISGKSLDTTVIRA